LEIIIKKKKLISIISPSYNEEKNVVECYERVKIIFASNLSNYDYEHIFTDNSSTDKTISLLREISKKDKRVKVIINSRNYGVFPSTFNAIIRSTGDAIIPMLPVDLQDPPEIIPKFVKKWENGFQVVAGNREERDEGFILQNIRKLYYRIISKLSSFYIPPDVGEFQLIDRAVVNALSQFEDYNPYIRGMIASCGFNSTTIHYKHLKRQKGKSKFNLFSYFDTSLNAVISVSNVPMRIAFILGSIIAISSIIWALYLVIEVLFFGVNLAQPGIMSLLVGLFFFSGIILLFLGLLGEYISAIHSQVRKKPLVIEREKINFFS